MREWRLANGGYLGLALSAVLGLLVCFLPATNASCAMLNHCNGHGRCDYEHIRCVCDEGWGANTDVAVYKAPDCSQRTCPAGKAWGDLPTDPNTAHAEAECSNAGLCNRQTGRCECFQGYEGNACQRIGCPNGCSGHGQCLSMQQLALRTDAFPLGANREYNEWDAEMLYACVCDSSWEVGLGPGQRQLSEWFGPDCSQRRCPSGDDPLTDWDETDCSGVVAAGGMGVGEPGNICHVECSNRGVCNYETGQCQCFHGHYSENCALTSALAS